MDTPIASLHYLLQCVHVPFKIDPAIFLAYREEQIVHRRTFLATGLAALATLRSSATLGRGTLQVALDGAFECSRRQVSIKKH